MRETTLEKFDITKKDSLHKKYVVQRNELLYGKTTVFNVTDLKIFKLIISKVNSKNILFDDFYEIASEELKALNINEKHLYSITLDSLKKLANVYMKIDTNDLEGNGVIKEVGLIQNNFTFKKYSNKFYIAFHQDMKDYLLDIQEKYTRYPLADISSLKLKHSLKLYEYLKSISFEEIIISIEKLKKRLDISLNSYEKYAMFKIKVLDPVMQEINERTSLNVQYEPIREGKKIVKIKFKILKIVPKKQNLIELEEPKYEDKFQKYLNQKFSHNDDSYQIIEIDKNLNIARVKNVDTGEIGKISAKNEIELIDKIEYMMNNDE